MSEEVDILLITIAPELICAKVRNMMMKARFRVDALRRICM
jgi:hypothetical protein